MQYPERFDVIVVGGGHAGTEAALASARMGRRTLLLTHNMDTIGQLSCNPSIGGIGKGQLIKEIDAMGGAMALAADMAAIHLKVLNRSKGPAMFGHHAVLDRQLYKQAIRDMVEHQPNLRVFQQEVDDLLLQGDHVTGVITKMGITFSANSVVLTAGTFLNGKIHVGLRHHAGGRAGEAPSVTLADRLKELNLPQGRLKTGTPARIDGRSIDFSQLKAQYSDGYDTGELPVFSLRGSRELHPEQRACYFTHTTTETHDILRSGFDQSPMFTGIIEGIGPRYCPSIEDKITRFADKDSHQIILEPEGLHSQEWYPNGISTSLPFEVQYHAIRSMPGMQNAHLTRPGYAIEYDYYAPTSLKPSLESKHIHGLFMAGQIIGSTGYSEAAAMGLLAGINAACHASEQDSFVPARHESYLGVMIDDLTTKELTEPYRMFTSRAEFRLYLREDNADVRLMPHAHALGLIDEQQWQAFQHKQEAVQMWSEALQSMVVSSHNLTEEEQTTLTGSLMKREYRLSYLLKRADITLAMLLSIPSIQQRMPSMTTYHTLGYSTWWSQLAMEQAVIDITYHDYLLRQQNEVNKLKTMNGFILPVPFDYSVIETLSTEVQQKMNRYQPSTIGQASHIQGITSTALSILMIYCKKHGLSA